jgi:ABC-type uncharacterized transport system substrate-binding protein
MGGCGTRPRPILGTRPGGRNDGAIRGASPPSRGGARAALCGLAAALLAWPTVAGGHPHVFVDYAVTLLLGSDSLDGVRLAWTFDDLFSGFILQEFDGDRNQALSPAEVARIEQRHLAEFQKVGYYTTINVNGKPAPAQPARAFRATVAGGIVTYEFVLPVTVPLATTTALEIYVDDPVYYIAYVPTAVTPPAHTARGFALECRVAKDRTGASPDAVRCGVRRR